MRQHWNSAYALLLSSRSVWLFLNGFITVYDSIELASYRARGEMAESKEQRAEGRIDMGGLM